ncbi:endo-1,3-beta glucanase [Sporothrix curviconia]|uniref:Endo-1,3-beta glucanase n=1 Tax=Sporothrix curviconia TaxID=1260050 RepID=A0ABP0BP53_9PEZI
MDSDDDYDELAAGEPPVIDPYAVLGLDRAAAPTVGQVKSAYRKAALRCHPDKVAPDQRESAHVQFQEVAFAYAVLSDPARRKRYDETGSTAESVVDSDGFSWSDFYRAAFADAVNPDAIEAFAATYKHSDEEHDDVLAAYTKYKGNMDGVYESVMLSDVLADDERFRGIIDAAIEAGNVKAFPKYTKETASSKKARLSAAKSESREAEEYAKELGVHDKLFGKKKSSQKGESTSGTKSDKRGKSSKSKADDDQAGLAALIQKRQQDRSAAFLDNLAAKYGATEQKKKKKTGGKKRQATDEADEDDEPSEEAFQAAAARLKNAAHHILQSSLPTPASSSASATAPTTSSPVRLPGTYSRNRHAMTEAATAATDAAAQEAANGAPGEATAPAESASSTTIAFYGQYCFHLSPTLNRWCPMRIADVVKLVQYADFEGQNVFFHLNHPVKWVRITGVVVACAEYYGRRVYTVDDGSGATIECSVPASKQQQQQQQQQRQQQGQGQQQQLLPVIDHPGTVVDVKGELRTFRNAFQIHVVKLAVLRATQQEVQFWAKAQQFAASTLYQPWVLDRQTVRKYRKAAMEIQRGKDDQ